MMKIMACTLANPDGMQKHLSKCGCGNKLDQEIALQSAKKQPKLQFTPYTSKSTRSIITSNTAFLQTENQQLKKQVHMLKPRTRVSTRKEVVGPPFYGVN